MKSKCFKFSGSCINFIRYVYPWKLFLQLSCSHEHVLRFLIACTFCDGLINTRRVTRYSPVRCLIAEPHPVPRRSPDVNPRMRSPKCVTRTHTLYLNTCTNYSCNIHASPPLCTTLATRDLRFARASRLSSPLISVTFSPLLQDVESTRSQDKNRRVPWNTFFHCRGFSFNFSSSRAPIPFLTSRN